MRLRLSASIVAPLRQPLSWITIVLGGLSLFNMMRHLGLIDLPGWVDLIDAGYVAVRDLIFAPLEFLTAAAWPAVLKNGFVLFAAVGRAYVASVGLIRTELDNPPEPDRGYRPVAKSYPPFEAGRLSRVLGAVQRLLQRLPERLRRFARPVLMAVASVTWPYAIGQIWRQPTVSLDVHGPEEVGQPSPLGRGHTELPPMDEFGGYQVSPKFPATGSETRPIYDARIVVLTFLAAQAALAALLVLACLVYFAVRSA